MKITPKEIIQVWNACSTIAEIYESQNEFSVWMKRFFAYAKSEVVIWNDLSKEEREKVADKNIELPIQPAELPDDLPSDAYTALEVVAKGKVKKPESQIEKLLKK